MENISLIIIAMQEELDGVKSLLKEYKEEQTDIGTIYKFTINNVNYIMTLGKIGKVSTAFFLGKLSMKYNIERIFNIGTSGGFSSSLNVGDVVIASGVIYHDVDVIGFGYEEGQIPSMPRVYLPDDNYIIFKRIDASEFDFALLRGLIASGDSFITKDNFPLLPSFIKEYALCGEMESGAVAQCATLMNIPFVIVRSISDIVLVEDNSKMMDNNMELACRNVAKVLIKLIS